MESDGSEELNIDKKEKKRIKREKDRKKQMERIIKLRELEKIRMEKDEVIYELMEGLRYTDKLPLRQLVDDECTHPSRVLLTKLMIEMGADPNV